jgi:hypothetical protein
MREPVARLLERTFSAAEREDGPMTTRVVTRSTVGHDPPLRLTTGAWAEDNTDGLWRRPGL